MIDISDGLLADAGHLAAAECRWLLFVAEFDRREGWMAWGCRGCTQWLSWRCGIDARTARDKLRVAHGLALFPRVREAFSTGRLSYTKARALIRVASPDTEEELVGMALHATGAHVESISRGYLRVARAEDRANGIDPARGGRVDFVGDDEDPNLGLVIARLTVEEQALVRCHPTVGSELIARVPYLRAAVPIIQDAHERMDGLGYPRGVRAADVSIGARIVCLADAYDTMTRPRVFRDAIAPREALLEVDRCSGTQFDPAVVEAFRSVLDAL